MKPKQKAAIPFSKLVVLLLIFAATLQIIIIGYNHFTEYYTVTSFPNFLTRFVYSSFLTAMAALVIAYPDLALIATLNKRLPWSGRMVERFSVQFVATLLIAMAVAILITLFSHALDAYQQELKQVLVTNILVTSVVNVILVIFLEAWLFSTESTRARKRAEDLSRELSQVKFQVLKSQMNPHFMFNSLNVLSALIDEDKERAQDFLEEFSSIYRYVLESIDRDVVSVKEELAFARSYIFLQQIRYGQGLRIDIKIPAEHLTFLVPPLSLQVLLENAMKHNRISETQPLTIQLYTNNAMLIVRNNLQPKDTSGFSTGVGQTNLIKRYELLEAEAPGFWVEAAHYRAQIPLLKPQNDENPDC
ncbi:MAG: sensor histidine kinase [Bacteroidota bacterium]